MKDPQILQSCAERQSLGLGQRAAFAALILAASSHCIARGGGSSVESPRREPKLSAENRRNDPSVLIAFIADQGNSLTGERVLKLIKQEGAVATLHSGDFDYVDSPSIWNERINRILGDDYPYLALIGNHDANAWAGPNGYGSYVASRIARIPELTCSGEPGIQASCSFRGIRFVLSCIGVWEYDAQRCAKDAPEQLEFIRSSLAGPEANWSICAWHKNQADMQTGDKADEVGWQAYRECMNAGAMIATGHEHVYARTRLLTDLGNSARAHGVSGTPDVIELGPGRTFVIVSGVGGGSVRDYRPALHDDDSWWASYYTRNRWLRNGLSLSGNGVAGALFIRFGAGGEPKRARAYFKDINGRIADEFTIYQSR